MPFEHDMHMCRAALERALHEYTEYYEKHIGHECIDFEEMLCLKKLAKTVYYTHAAYHIAIEMQTGKEDEKMWHDNPRRMMTHNPDGMTPMAETHNPRAAVRPV